MPRGGLRNGKPGASYGNRTDLNVAKLPAVAAPGQTYGQAGAQMAAQKQVPIAPQPTAGGAGLGEGAAPPAVTPGQFGPLDRPTDRPDEPLTAGAAIGPGPGPVSPPPAPDPLMTTVAALNSLGDRLDPTLRRMVTVLQATQGNGAGA